MNTKPLNQFYTASDEILDKKILDKYDYIIVGAGSAGCVITRRLVDAGQANILLIEAGDCKTEMDSITNPMLWLNNIGAAHDYLYKYKPSQILNNRIILAPRGKLLGGSGSINALVWARGNKADYNNWAAAGNKGWDYNSVLPLFKKIEDWEFGETDYHGAGGPIHVECASNMHHAAAAFIDAGISYGMPYLQDTNGPEPEGVGPMSLNIRDGIRSSPFSGYLAPVIDNPRLTVLTNTQVTSLIIEGSQCVGVNFLYQDEHHSIKASKEVILSAGTFESPRILMLSGIGPKEDLESLGIDCILDLPGVGKNLQDHPLITSLCFETKMPSGQLTHNMLGSIIYTKSNQPTNTPDLMIMLAQAPLISDQIRAKYVIPENSICFLPTLIKVKSRGYLKMITSKYDGPLEIQPNFLAEEQDLEALIDAVEICLNLASEPVFEGIIKCRVSPSVLETRDDIKAFLRDACSSYFHPVGTCAMGFSTDSVVDDQLKVHGIIGLRVADASIMPEITSANTNAPTLMIGEFVSRLILA